VTKAILNIKSVLFLEFTSTKQWGVKFIAKRNNRDI